MASDSTVDRRRIQARMRELADAAYEDASPQASSSTSLVSTLVPRTEVRRRFGIVPALMFAAKGVQAGLQFLSTDKGKKYLAKINDEEKQSETRYKLAMSKAERAKTPAAKQRWTKRAERYKDAWEQASWSRKLAEHGVVGEGPVLEYRRNLLAMEWEGADDARKAEIEAAVLAWDKRLERLHKERDLRKRMFQGGSAALRRGPSSSPVHQRRDWVKLGLIAGKGGLQFDAMSPPGPARLVRVPLYPMNRAQAWTGVNGIDRPGDDPVLRIQFDQNQQTVGPFWMQTDTLAYGRYRIVGLQINRGNSYYFNAPSTVRPGPVAVSISDLSVYNGAELFVIDGGRQMDADTYSVLPVSRVAMNLDALVPPLAPVVLNYNFWDITPNQSAKKRHFAGLRDSPIIDTDATVQMAVHAFVGQRATWPPQPVPPPPFGDRVISIPFTATLVVDILEDKVYGAPVNPSPSSRAGAVTKVAAVERNLGYEGRDQLAVVSSRYDPRR